MFRLARICLAESLVNAEVIGKVAVLKLNRPQALNALNTAIVDELSQKVSPL
jgi:enoyl-CoA hydratase/carnithine racemase